MSDEKAHEIGDYILGRTLGSGTTGKVKLATKKGTTEQYAIKIIKKSAFEAKPHLQQKIRREVALMRLLNHPHLLKLVEFAESQRHLYIILEYAQNGELFDFLIKRHSLPFELGMHFFQEMVFALEYLHDHAICHRDLKPENILLDQFNHIKIADFGFARWMRSNIAETSCGSPHYAAPEVIKGIPYDGRFSDIWSLGVILFALLSGKLPFDDPSIRNLLTKVKQGRYRMPDIPKDIQDLISHMLTVDPAQRITIAQIKEHKAFRMYSPELYVFPKPFKMPFIADPVDPITVPQTTFSVLKCIGYQSDQEIIDELSQPTHSMAKVFSYMLSRNISVDALEWPNDDGNALPVDAFLFSPNVEPAGSLHTSDPFRRRRPIADVSSLETFSLVDTTFGGFGSENDTEQLEQIPQLFDLIPVPLDELMCTLQQCLTNDAGYEWLHPDDLHLFARNIGVNSYVVFSANYIDEDSVTCSLIPIKIVTEQFEALISIVQASIGELLKSRDDGQF